MDVRHDGQIRTFHVFEDDDRKLSFLFQFGEHTRHFEVRVDFFLDPEYLIRLLPLKLGEKSS
jgi:hypothetical protein